MAQIFGIEIETAPERMLREIQAELEAQGWEKTTCAIAGCGVNANVHQNQRIREPGPWLCGECQWMSIGKRDAVIANPQQAWWLDLIRSTRRRNMNWVVKINTRGNDMVMYVRSLGALTKSFSRSELESFLDGHSVERSASNTGEAIIIRLIASMQNAPAWPPTDAEVADGQVGDDGAVHYWSKIGWPV